MPTGTSHSTQDNLSFLCLSSHGSLLHDPLLAGSEPLPSESLWTHLVSSWIFLEFRPLLKTACPLSVRHQERKAGPAFPQSPGAPGGRGSLLASSVPPLCPLGPPEEQVSGTYIEHHVCNEQEERCSLDSMQPSCLGPSPEEGQWDTEMGKANSDLQAAPTLGRVGVREPDGNGQHRCLGLW